MYMLLYLFLTILVYLFTFTLLLNNFVNIETKLNQDHINAIANSVDREMSRISNLTDDYSNWDDTYDFIETNDQNYIYENFRDQTATLEDLSIDGIMFIKEDKEILFSKYTPLLQDTKKLERSVLDQFQGKTEFATIVQQDGKYFYLIKSEILKSDETGVSKGSIVSVKLITQELLNNINKIFKNVTVVDIYENNDTNVITTFENFTVSLKKELSESDIFNFITLNDKVNNKALITFEASNKRDIVLQAKRSIWIVDAAISIILFFIFYILYKNQKFIESKNFTLDKLVQDRTKLLENALEELKNKNEELFLLAHTDSLTKINNRGSFFKESMALLNSAIHYKKEFCFLIIDIDYFKSINDRYGHAIGDQVLIKFCEIVNKYMDNQSVFGRIGGEEFCVSFYDKNDLEVERISENIKNECENTLIHAGEHQVSFSVSMGLSCREDLTNIDLIMKNADDMLYKAKKTGRNKLIRQRRNFE
ncbi:sensor domain-containing diguanylate cyclase [Sulfurimonas sp.]